MNLGKLLAAGKSWMNGRAEISYRVNKQIYLPKFESPKNPFAHLPKALAEIPATPKKEAVAAKTQKSPAIAAASKPQTNWVGRLNPISVLRPASPAPESKKELPAVQAELSLDAVKVVHNDLTDADVEVVPMKSRPAPPDLQPARKSWEILGERLLKATAL